MKKNKFLSMVLAIVLITTINIPTGLAEDNGTAEELALESPAPSAESATETTDFSSDDAVLEPTSDLTVETTAEPTPEPSSSESVLGLFTLSEEMVLLNGSPTSGNFRVKNNNGPGGDHGYMRVTYNGITVNLDRGGEHTFTYSSGAGDVEIDFVPDTGYAFEYYVIGNGASHINDDPEYINPSSYAGRSGSNNMISVNPKWKKINAYTVTWNNYDGAQLEQDTNVLYGATPNYGGATPKRDATAEFT